MRNYLLVISAFILVVAIIIAYSSKKIDAEVNDIKHQFDANSNGLIDGQETINALKAWEVSGEDMLEIPGFDKRMEYLNAQNDQRAMQIFGTATKEWLVSEKGAFNSKGTLVKNLVRKIADKDDDGVITFEEGAEVLKFGQYEPQDFRGDAQRSKKKRK